MLQGCVFILRFRFATLFLHCCHWFNFCFSCHDVFPTVSALFFFRIFNQKDWNSNVINWLQSDLPSKTITNAPRLVVLVRVVRNLCYFIWWSRRFSEKASLHKDLDCDRRQTHNLINYNMMPCYRIIWSWMLKLRKLLSWPHLITTSITAALLITCHVAFVYANS